MSDCPFCNAPKKAVESEVLNQTEETRLLHLHCQSCENSVLALILSSPAGLTSLGIITDLSKSDVARLRSSKSQIMSDDVIELHQSLEQGLTF